ncbi:unnamed protein product [Closterium sp. Naga37s-1]|nr:unnamed protein product [Closterium sp. Naga37s-1]
MVPPRVAQLLAARRAGRASAGGRGYYYSRSASSAVRASSAAAPKASAADTAALTAIFTAARIPIPANQSNACTWYGVYCAADGGAVQRLYLNVYAPSVNFLLRYLPFPPPPSPHPRLLPGQSSPHLSHLLTTLSSYFSVSPLLAPRPIPTFCQSNQRLRLLNLASNALSGPPTPLSSPSCSASLAYLNLSSNRLSGSIPATISSFNRLKRLSLYSNTLTGAIPAAPVASSLTLFPPYSPSLTFCLLSFSPTTIRIHGAHLKHTHSQHWPLQQANVGQS